MSEASPLGLYIHVPHCTVRCSYCDFYLRAGKTQDLNPFLRALETEIRAAGGEFGARCVDTVHFGGGTPSLLGGARLSLILDALRDSFPLEPGGEIALEANPEDLDAEGLERYAAAGVNRVSIGVQSLDDDLLRRMRRPHDAARALEAVRAARASAVRSVGADLILGLPGQKEQEALEGITRLVDRGVDHLSLYLLELQPRTDLGRQIRDGLLFPMPDDRMAALYERAADGLVERGFEHYEISNFALPGYRSRHNLKYWTDREYLGFGPSAHSYLGGRRWWNAAHLDAYLLAPGPVQRRAEEGGTPARRAFEALMAGLRLSEGIDLTLLRARYGSDCVAPSPEIIEQLVRAGLLAARGVQLSLTRRGRLVSNEVLERLLPAIP